MAQKKKTKKIGNKQNSYLNGEWAAHGRPFGKKVASKARRVVGKDEIRDRVNGNE